MAERSAKIEKYKAAFRRLRGERDQLAEYAAGVEKERDARPTTEQLNKVTGQLRGDRFKAKFGELAKKAGVREDAIDAAYQLAGITPDTDEPDEGKLSDVVKKTVEKSKFLLQPEEDGKEKNRPTKEKLAAGEGSATGSADKSVGGFTVSESQARDPAWMAQNQGLIAEHATAGTLRWM